MAMARSKRAQLLDMRLDAVCHNESRCAESCKSEHIKKADDKSYRGMVARLFHLWQPSFRLYEFGRRPLMSAIDATLHSLEFTRSMLE